MKISSIRAQILVLPEADPLGDTPENPNAARPIVIVRIGTDDGIEGIGVTFYGGAITASLKRAVDDLGALTIGEDPLRVEAIIAKLRAAAARPDLCERCTAAQPAARRSRGRGRKAEGQGLPRDEDAARVTRRYLA